MKKIIKRTCLTLICLLTILSCSENESNLLSPASEANAIIETADFSGNININENMNIPLDKMEIVSFYEKSDINNDGSFSIKSINSDNYQLTMVQEKNTSKLLYIGIADPQTHKIQINDTTTALALTLINPYLVFSEKNDRTIYLEEIKSNPKFSELIQSLDQAYETNPSTVLDYNVNPNIYQLAVQVMKTTLDGENGVVLNKKASIGGPPTIEDIPGSEIKIINPRYVYYAAGIYPNGAELKETITCPKADKLISFKWDWPPVAVMEPNETNYNLGNGSFRIYITKGFDFTKFTQWNDPCGRATMMNTGQSILYLLDLVMGSKLGDLNLATLPNHFHIPLSTGYDLTKSVVELDAGGFLKTLGGLIIENADELVFWIWQETANDAASQFLHSVGGILSNFAIVTKILGFANEQGPFFFDMIFAPKEVTYNINQQNGILVTNNINNSPEAEFTITPPAGIIGTSFLFDASPSTDDNTNSSQLKYRWDFESDGIWDINWTTNRTTSHSFNETGSYFVRLDVKDNDELIGTKVHKVNIGGGAGTANHVKLFMDGLPWDSNAMITMLKSIGFKEGPGEDQYEIIHSSEMSLTDLVPGIDLVIISNDQDQNFYNNYSANQVKFSSFVYAGGSLFWEACDEGWANGSIKDANIVLPGDVKVFFDYDFTNYIGDQNLPLVSDLPNIMDHNYASHESFYDLPDGTTIYTIDESSNPTLIEFNLEGGWVIMTGQPLEHQYDRIYGNPDMEQLLPRIISYFTGKELNNNLTKVTRSNASMTSKPSYYKFH